MGAWHQILKSNRTVLNVLVCEMGFGQNFSMLKFLFFLFPCVFAHPDSASLESVQVSVIAQADARDRRNKQVCIQFVKCEHSTGLTSEWRLLLTAKSLCTADIHD